MDDKKAAKLLEKYNKMIEKKKYGKIYAFAANLNDEEKVLFAQACGAGEDDEPFNVLVHYLDKEEDVSVRLAAINGLGAFGNPKAISHLSWFTTNPDGLPQELVDAAALNIRKLRNRA